MVRIALGDSSDDVTPILDVQISSGGVLTDPATLEFVIYDLTSGSPVQVFPVSGRQAIVIAAPPTGSQIATGHFFAPWTAPTTLNVGTHRIDWFFTEVIAGPEFTTTEEFEVYNPAAVGDPFYTTIGAFRGLGVSALDVDDATLTLTMRIVHQLVERYCRQHFNPRTLEFRLDGNNADTLFLPLPVISVEFLRINDSTQDLGTDFFRVYNGRAAPNDDRHNPKIVLDRSTSDAIYRLPFTGVYPKFLKGRQNQHVRGVFGYTEADGSTPAPIIDAVERLVIDRLSNPPYGAAPIVANTGIAGTIIMEKTDGHEYRVASETSERPAGLDGITKDPYIRDILRMYRAPKGVGAPTDWHI
jgi:hypothetical protein